MKNEAMKLALDLAIMHHTDEGYYELRSKVRVAAKEALAKQEQGGPVIYGGHTASEMAFAILDSSQQKPEHVAIRQAFTEANDKRLDELRKQEQGEPVAWFDNAGTIHGHVSDEQLDALCRSAVAEISKRNGWAEEAPSLSDYKRLQALVTSQGIRLMEYESTVYTTPQQRKPLDCFETEKLAKQCGVEWTTSIDKLCKLAADHSIKE